MEGMEAAMIPVLHSTLGKILVGRGRNCWYMIDSAYQVQMVKGAESPKEKNQSPFQTGSYMNLQRKSPVFP